MKILLILLLITNVAQASDEYVVPKDIVEIRDKIVLKTERFKNRMLKRYIVLSKKKNLSLKEERELYALDSVIASKDLAKAEENLMKIHKKDVPLKIMDK